MANRLFEDVHTSIYATAPIFAAALMPRHQNSDRYCAVNRMNEATDRRLVVLLIGECRYNKGFAMTCHNLVLLCGGLPELRWRKWHNLCELGKYFRLERILCNELIDIYTYIVYWLLAISINNYYSRCTT